MLRATTRRGAARLDARTLLQLHPSIGNAAVARLVHSQNAAAKAPLAGAVDRAEGAAEERLDDEHPAVEGTRAHAHGAPDAPPARASTLNGARSSAPVGEGAGEATSRDPGDAARPPPDGAIATTSPPRGGSAADHNVSAGSPTPDVPSEASFEPGVAAAPNPEVASDIPVLSSDGVVAARPAPGASASGTSAGSGGAAPESAAHGGEHAAESGAGKSAETAKAAGEAGGEAASLEVGDPKHPPDQALGSAAPANAHVTAERKDGARTDSRGRRSRRGEP